jgi:hypothetical protein
VASAVVAVSDPVTVGPSLQGTEVSCIWYLPVVRTLKAPTTRSVRQRATTLVSGHATHQ